ncbi:MAG: hypothetical protein COA47_10030 [Robiginitomaculum sp.]|nr:MAG: hypothetical protein COA47_10030 [Robiginitomaculum sp.]
MNFIEFIQEVISLAELQVAAFAENPAEAVVYIKAIELFKKHLTWHPANHSCKYLAGVMAMLRTQVPDYDTVLSDVIGNTLGLIDDGAESRYRLATARAQLKALGVML